METVPDTFPSLFWGYTVIWALLCAYMVSLARRMRRVEKNLDEKK